MENYTKFIILDNLRSTFCRECTLHSLQKVLSTNGWFFIFLSTEHATLPQKAKELFGKILQDVTELNDRDARVGG